MSLEKSGSSITLLKRCSTCVYRDQGGCGDMWMNYSSRNMFKTWIKSFTGGLFLYLLPRPVDGEKWAVLEKLYRLLGFPWNLQPAGVLMVQGRWGELRALNMLKPKLCSGNYNGWLSIVTIVLQQMWWLCVPCHEELTAVCLDCAGRRRWRFPHLSVSSPGLLAGTGCVWKRRKLYILERLIKWVQFIC